MRTCYTFIILTPPTLLGTITGCVVALQARTFTLGLVRAEGPPGVARLAHASAMLGAITAGLGLAVRTHAHVRCNITCAVTTETALGYTLATN